MTTHKLAAVFAATWGTLLMLGPIRRATFVGVALVLLGVLILEAPKLARLLGVALVLYLGHRTVWIGSSRLAAFLWVALLCFLIKIELDRRRSRLSAGKQ